MSEKIDFRITYQPFFDCSKQNKLKFQSMKRQILEKISFKPLSVFEKNKKAQFQIR